MGVFGIDLLLTPGTITYRENAAIMVNLVWALMDLARVVTTCRIATALDVESDHLPIETTLQIPAIQEEPSRRRNWKRTDVRKLKESIRLELINSLII